MIPAATTRLQAFLLALPVCLLLVGCGTTRSSATDLPDEVTRQEARAEIEFARADAEAGRDRRALRRLAGVRKVRNLAPDDRADAERLLRDAFGRLLDAYEESGAPAEDYLVLYRLELPETMRATAGMLAAQRQLEDDRPVKAFRQVREVDRKLPNHDARLLGGEVLGRIGLDLIARRGTYSLFFSYRARGVEALEYLVVQYPLSPSCPAAYVELSRYYEDTADLDYAIERLDDLVLYHPNDPIAIDAEARLPELRLARLDRDDFDRSEIDLARREAERWLARHEGHARTEEVRELARRSWRKLAKNDLVLARYYETVDSPFGARLHAERALQEALQAGAERQIGEARAMLASLTALEPEEREKSMGDAEQLIDDLPAPVNRN